MKYISGNLDTVKFTPFLIMSCEQLELKKGVNFL